MNRLIVLDLDGTLLRRDKTISNKSIKVLKKCEKAGCKIVIATGRAFRTTHELIPKELNNEYLICYNGAEIYKDQVRVCSQYIDKQTVKSLVNFFHRNYPEIIVSLEIDNVLYSNFSVESIFGNIEHVIVDYHRMDFKPASKVLVDLSCVGNLKTIKDIIPLDCSMVITDGGNLAQIMAKGVSKWEAIRHVSDDWNLQMDDVIAFGDDFNDIEIIANSGIGVAMGNAVLDLKNVARYVTRTNDEDGVAFFLEEMLLKGKV